MLKKLSLGIIVLLGLGLYSLVPYSGGSPGGKTGSPADGKSCTQCHSGTPVDIDNWITGNIPENGYEPGQTYTITVEGTHEGVAKFGFELTAEDSQGSKQGQFIITNSNQTKLANNNKSVTHTSTGNSPSGNTKSWSFDWTAPEAGTGEVTLYAALNAANGNFGTSGDVIYRTTLPVPENTGTGLFDIELASKVKIYQSLDPNILVIDYPDLKGLENIRIYDLTVSLRHIKNIF